MHILQEAVTHKQNCLLKTKKKQLMSGNERYVKGADTRKQYKLHYFGYFFIGLSFLK